MKPRMFIGSSAEKLDLAYAAQENLEHHVESTVWTQGVFTLSRMGIASLIDKLDDSDFGLFVLSPDDVLQLRSKEFTSVRDNVIFELGLFIGRLGVERCFIITPRNTPELHLPSDLLGMTPAEYDAERQDGNLQAALGPAITRVVKAIRRLGRLTPIDEEPDRVAQPNAIELFNDPNDCVALIQSWMGQRPSSQNAAAITMSALDEELKMAPGSASLYIEEAADRWGYRIARKGNNIVLLERALPY